MLVVDDTGVTSRGWVHSRTLGWDEIRDYRIRVRPYWTTRLATMNEPWPRRHAEHAPPAESYELGFSDMQLELALHGDDLTLVGEGEGLDGLQLSNDVLPRLHRRLGVAALEQGPLVRFGSLAISERGIQWGDDAELSREHVEGIAVVALASPSTTGGKLELRVMRFGGHPYHAMELVDLPNIGGLVEVAGAFGYRLRGRDLLASLGIVELRARRP
jgi:hypothetical protein